MARIKHYNPETEKWEYSDASFVVGGGSNVAWRDPQNGEVFILDDSSGSETPDTNIPVTGISLNKTSLSLTVGSSEVLIADITPDNATNALVNWTTSSPNVATVANDGTVTAVGVGDAVITATSGDTTNGIISASCSVACAAAESGGDTGGDTGGEDDELDIPSANLLAYYDLREPLNDSGQIVDLSGNEVNLTIKDNAAQDYGIVMTDGYISREGLETYNKLDYPVESIKNITIDGTITVFATISNYENKTTPVIGFGKAYPPCLLLFQGGAIYYGSQFNNVTANTQIDTNETHHVLAVSLDINGNEKIYINGVLKSDIAVKTVPESGKIRPLQGYTSTTPSPKIRLHNAAFYSSVLDDQTVATISNTLKANAESSGGETPDTNVPVTDISLNKSTMSLTVGESEVLTANIKPDNATNILVNWTTSNSGVATVSNDGTVTAIGVGDAIITATSGDTSNGIISASCSVSCAEAESGGDDSGLDIPSADLMAYYDLRKPLTTSGQIADLSGNGIDLTLADHEGLVLGDGYISRENEGTYIQNWQPAKSEENIPINGAVTVFATISNYEQKTTPILKPGKGANVTSIVLFQGGVIFFDGAFNNVAANTQIDTNESYHVIAVSLETGGNEKIYINGVLKSDVAVKNVPVAGPVSLLDGYHSSGSTLLRLHNAAFYSSVLDDQTVATISSTLKTNAGGVA